jgi:hypothetical protein
MSNIKVGDTVLVTMTGIQGSRKIGRVVDIHRNFATNIQVAFKTTSYKVYYTADELKVITKKDDPEYFI